MEEMNKFSKKRKNYELLTESEISSKRRKLEEIILEEISTKNENLIQLQNNDFVNEKRSKLLTAIRLKKKYKYYCKKHNTRYLIENVRQEKKEITKDNRNKLLQNFRSLTVSMDPCKLSDEDNVNRTLNKAKDVLKRNRCDYSDDDTSDSEKSQFKKPKGPSLEITENSSAKNNYINNKRDYALIKNITNKENNQLKNSKLATTSNSSPLPNHSDTDDSFSDNEKCLFKKPKFPSLVTIKKDLRKTRIDNNQKRQLYYFNSVENDSSDDSDFFDYSKTNFPKSKLSGSIDTSNNLNKIIDENGKSDYEEGNEVWFKKPKLPTPLSLSQSSIESEINDDEDRDSDYIGYYSSIWFKKPNLVSSFSINKDSKEDERLERDYSAHKKTCRCKKPRIIKFSVLRKIPGEENVICSEHEDYIDSDYSNNDSNCYCLYHENLKNKLDDYEYESSSSSNDEDDSSISSFDSSYTG